ncbi:hypothetical protein GIS00_21875 [Nakamurella sp. YIM 132087]|uniref:HNH endonuclease n=1 Tax=Nakamurella alba TaxID=2665158 RepID=A0A7K1FR14_9ACTN|nr:hypothetical protein [Nakamurella alba]MTD16591.1 hypothetical protein [Nakamurella alba]
MATMDEVGERDGWRCWVCDEPVDPDRSVNDARGPSVDSYFTASKKKAPGAVERLAHRACNTRKGAVTPVISWPADGMVADPAVLLTSADRLRRKGGREVVGRCPGAAEGRELADWLTDRMSRLAPDLQIRCSVEAGGGQHLLVLTV